MGYDYDRRLAASHEELESALDEVFDAKVLAALDKYAHMIIQEGQAAHKVLHNQVKYVQTRVQGGDAIRSNDLVRAVTKHIAEVLGEDALAKVVAQALATGDYLF